MRDAPGWKWSEWLLVTVLAACAPAGVAQGVVYIQEDARLTGKQVHFFSDNREQVTVVLGRFRLVIGRRVLSGRDAVLWIRDLPGAPAGRHDVTVYIEGDAKVVEPGGRTTDRVMLVRLRQQGRFSVSGRAVRRPLTDFPLYQRALKLRDSAGKGLAVETPSRPVRHEAPELIISRRKPVVTPRAATARSRPAAGAPAPTRPRAVQPVTFHAGQFTSQRHGAERITIARKGVYLSQGNPDSALFLELRSRSAAIFSGRRAPKKTSVPISPRIGGVQTDLPGPGRGAETIIGAYLEGDVVMARGERYVRCSSAYYDFTTDRAILIEPVFRTIQKQRDIPVYVRAARCRALSARELYFSDAMVSTSDFYSPTYHVSARRVWVMDNTVYDEKGKAVSQRKWRGKMRHGLVHVRNVPVLYFPVLEGDLSEANIPLRKLQVGRDGRFGFGVQTEWYLFRLLGLVEPPGFKGRLELDYHDRGFLAGTRIKYARPEYSGYGHLVGLIDRKEDDDFGEERENVPAPQERGRLLLRHKHVLPRDWQLQTELSYICDRNFLEQFFPNEFHAGKEQETLIYAKKQRDHWAFTTLLKYRMNRFLSQAESAPDLGFYLIGQPLGDRLSLYSEARAGFKRFRPAKGAPPEGSGMNDSRIFLRLDTRQEVEMPLHLGPLNVVPYAMGRATYWDDYMIGGKQCRPYGQVGVKTNIHIWRVYNKPESRVWNVHRLKHIITPEAVVFLANATGVRPDHLFPMDPDIEQHLTRQHGYSIGLHQRLQTKRGPAGKRFTVDWMRFNVVAGFYNNSEIRHSQPADGRLFWYRPEYSLGRNHVNAEYTWNISDSTTLLADANYDPDSRAFRRANVGLAVSRDPRLRYFLGTRWIRDLDTNVGTAGFRYKINHKYTVSAFQQYDFEYRGGENLTTSVTITRKLPRWFVSLTFVYNEADDDYSFYLSLWPEGIPEVRLQAARIGTSSVSDMN